MPGVRLNLSGRGASVSVGGRGLTYNLSSRGTRVTASVPGTGLSWSHHVPRGGAPPSRSTPSDPFAPPVTMDNSEPLPPVAISGIPTKTFESAPIEKIASFSTSELAPILDATQRRFRLLWISIAVALLSVSAASQGSTGSLSISLVFGLLVVCIAALLDRYRRSVKIDFEFQGLAGNVATALSGSFDDLKQCSSVWNVTLEQQTSDWKRNAGATALNIRNEIRPGLGRPNCIRSGADFPNLKIGKTGLYFFPDGLLVVTARSVAALAYADIEINSRVVRFIESGPIPSDATIVDRTWRYVNKSGGPDRRFNSNNELPVCLYGEVDFQSGGGLNARIQYSKAEAGERLIKVIELLRKLGAATGTANTAISYSTPRSLPTAIYCTVLLVGASLLAAPSFLSNRVVETPRRVPSEQSSIPSSPPSKSKPMGGPLIESVSPKQATKTPRADVPATIGQPMSINPLASHPTPRGRPQ
jgi:uncharacterized protein DUF4236